MAFHSVRKIMSEWLYRFIYFQTHVIDLEINKIFIYGKYIFFLLFFAGLLKNIIIICRGEIGRKEPQIPDLGSYDPERPPTHELSQGINSAGFN